MIELCLSAPVGVLHTFAHSMWVSPVAHNLHVIRVGNVDISNFSGRLKFKSKPCSIKFDFSSCIERIDHIYEHYHNFHCPAHCNFKMGKVHCTGFYTVIYVHLSVLLHWPMCQCVSRVGCLLRFCTVHCAAHCWLQTSDVSDCICSFIVPCIADCTY